METEGVGDVTPLPGNHTYPSDTSVIVSSTPGEGWELDHYLIDDNDTIISNLSPVLMDANHTVKAGL